MRANKRTTVILCLLVSATFLGCPIPTEKDERLEGEWDGNLLIYDPPPATLVRYTRITVVNGILTLWVPGEEPISGEYFVDRDYSPDLIDWHTPDGVIRGYYSVSHAFSPEAELFFWFNDPRDPRPINTQFAKYDFYGDYD